MKRDRPPASLDRLRALLDAAAVRRVLIPLGAPAATALEVSELLQVPQASVAATVIAEADGDFLAAIVPGTGRVDTGKLATLLGARRVRIAGPQAVRQWLGGPREAQAPPALPWGEIPVLSGLPTLLDRALLTRDFVYGGTGDPGWVVRLAPADLKRASAAMVGDISRGGIGSSEARGLAEHPARQG